MNPDSAAALLDERLRPYPWYVSTGVGETSKGPALFVYVKARKPRLLSGIASGWNGYPVEVRVVGAIRSAKAGQIRATA